VEGQSQDNLHEEIEDVLQNLLSVYLCNKKDIEREEIEKFQHVYSGKLSLKSKMRHQISRDVLRLGSRTVQGIVVTADKLKTRKEISRLIGHVRRVHSYRQDDGGIFQRQESTARDGCQLP
jgi:hydrogenase maturation factor HypE